MKKVFMLQCPENTRDGLQDLMWSRSEREFIEFDLSDDEHTEQDLADARELHERKHYLGHVELMDFNVQP